MRPFITSAAALLLAATLSSCADSVAAPAAGEPITVVAQTAQQISTPDGTVDALLFTPEGTGPWPAVILWGDINGLRPTVAEIGRGIAWQGFVVLAPNAFYRTAEFDGFHEQEAIDFPEVMRRAGEWTPPLDEGGIYSDAEAYIAFLDALPDTDPEGRLGMVGFDYGSPYAFNLAAAMPERVKAVATIHPSRIATTRPNSPHLFVQDSTAEYYIAIAGPDDAREPEDKFDLRNAFDAAGLTAEVEVIDAAHGFAMYDNAGFDAAKAQGAIAKLTALLHRALD